MKVPPIAYVAIYFLVCACTAQLVGAMDPLQEMLKMAGAYGHLDGADQDCAVKYAIGLGVSFSVLAGMFVGIVLDLVGPKMVALLGHGLLAGGLSLMFYGLSKVTIPLGAICLGFAFQCLVNSHVSVSCLFPANVAFVLAVLGAAPDISLYVAAAMQNLVNHLISGQSFVDDAAKKAAMLGTVQKVIGGYLMFIVSACAVLDFFFVPMRPHEPESAGSEDKLLSCGSNDGLYGTSEDVEMPASLTIRKKEYKSMTLAEQLRTSHYWIFVPFFVLNFLRRKNFSSNCRAMFFEVSGSEATAAKFTDLFNSLVPLGFIPAIMWGVFTDRFGIVASILMANVFGCLIAVLPLVPIIAVQYLSILSYVMLSSYMFGLLYAFLASLYGFGTLATLQGIASTAAGGTSAVVDIFWNPFIVHSLGGSYLKANIIVAAMGAVMFLAPIYMLLRPPPIQAKVTKAASKQQFEVFDPKTFSITGQIFDKASLAAMNRRNA